MGIPNREFPIISLQVFGLYKVFWFKRIFSIQNILDPDYSASYGSGKFWIQNILVVVVVVVVAAAAAVLVLVLVLVLVPST